MKTFVRSLLWYLGMLLLALALFMAGAMATSAISRDWAVVCPVGTTTIAACQ